MVGGDDGYDDDRLKRRDRFLFRLAVSLEYDVFLTFYFWGEMRMILDVGRS